MRLHFRRRSNWPPRRSATSKRRGSGSARWYIRELARRVADGELDLDGWCRERDPEILRQMLLGVKGIGSYGASHMLMLLGHYGMIPCDSEVRAYLGISAKASARDVERRAAKRDGRWGRYAFLAYKFERRVLQAELRRLSGLIRKVRPLAGDRQSLWLDCEWHDRG